MSLPILFDVRDRRGRLVDGGSLHNALEPAVFDVRRGTYAVVVWPTCSRRITTTGFNVVAVALSGSARTKADCSVRQFE